MPGRRSRHAAGMIGALGPGKQRRPWRKLPRVRRRREHHHSAPESASITKQA
ncbi:hypothetical protein PAHAL_2G420800 [Panicum hallii]|uniref:Uncharacterized protein n=1 Tax=Panicum hallii TaxID=206008 RepID=A0A2T8KSB6_9POAL|nr:hypothetical protein PAHAL_2G420800 [Panicum hallii]